MAFSFKLPDIGEGIHEGEIVQWLVQPGDFVKEDQAIVEVMTDKVTAEIPAPVSGVIQELHGKAGEVVKVGSVIAVFDQSKTSASNVAPKPVTTQNVEASASNAIPTQVPAPLNETQKAKAFHGNGVCTKQANDSPSTTGQKVLAAPATRKLARQLGIDLSTVIASATHGRVTQDDVRRAVGSQGTTAAQTCMAKPSRTTSTNGFRTSGEQRVPMSGLRRKIAEHLVKSKQTAPHFAYVEEVDMSKLVAMRDDLLPIAKEEGVKLNYLPFIIKAVIAGLRKYPVLNSQLDETTQEIVYKNDYHIGVAVAAGQGLVVPVVKHADQKSLFTLSHDISTLAEKARNGKLSLDEMKGGTFTLTSIGSIGGLFSVPIINYPEVAIMGINKIEKRPVVRNINGEDTIVIREMMHLSLSGDHRVVDGSEAALFVKEVIQYLENPSRLLLVEGM